MITSRHFIRQSMVAALYITISLAIAPLSFGMVQIRFAEMLMLLVYIDNRYSIALITGCLLTNLYSPLGIIDAVFGTLATALSCYAMTKTNRVYGSLLILPLLNGMIIGFELTYLWKLPFLLSALSVAAGEFAAVFIGIFLYKKFETRLRQMIVS